MACLFILCPQMADYYFDIPFSLHFSFRINKYLIEIATYLLLRHPYFIDRGRKRRINPVNNDFNDGPSLWTAVIVMSIFNYVI